MPKFIIFCSINILFVYKLCLFVIFSVSLLCPWDTVNKDTYIHTITACVDYQDASSSFSEEGRIENVSTLAYFIRSLL